MKKWLIIAVIAVVCMSFQTSLRDAFENLFSETTEYAKQAPSGVTYGVTQETPTYLLVNTPLGEYQIQKENGGYRFLGVFAKVKSRKGSVYKIDSSLGNFTVDMKKRSIRKD